ncbi:superoxide dismutase family protein [Xylophilus ampelinus]|uniref:Superoxide dismutase [Cu-Zn] n=1 Tax=Xylophilus ampelinus TaxID=54067 RepID=A0A318SDG5_9BURK|nr:superoxide dismutase family protein [Xylophilus ampelinus]MCS4508674.1 superoxide dismutase family protein [Xylophilus ampelinus]PYE74311.1 Cu-Zn family superoxide dismutase [Xylophilus ampelinus]
MFARSSPDRRPLASSTAAACLSLLLTGCAGPPCGSTAVADLRPTPGHAASGNIAFRQLGGIVQVTGTVWGLPPGTEHGFHIHEVGDCGRDGDAAGGHFNPQAVQHGRFGEAGVHAGELPSLHADSTGTATFSIDTRAISLGNGPTGVLGRALVVHRDRDDYHSQPAGDSGPRIACGVIEQR